MTTDGSDSPDAVPFSPSFVLPDSLDDLHGPSTGTVDLPNRLLWNQSRPFDLSDESRLLSMIRIVVREARSRDDLAQFVDRASLVRLWPELGLPEYIRQGWEARFPELNDDARTQEPARLTPGHAGSGTVTDQHDQGSEER